MAVVASKHRSLSHFSDRIHSYSLKCNLTSGLLPEKSDSGFPVAILVIASTVQLKVQSGFWLVLTEKSDSGFPIVNPAYEAAIALTLVNNYRS